MDRLPKELYALIFSHLTQQEKLQCVLVNRRWYKKIMQLGVLFSPLMFLYDHPQVLEAMEYFERHPDMAHQINELIYNDRDSPDDEQFVRFPVFFNNLKTLKFKVEASADIGKLPVLEGEDAVLRFQIWSSTLRSLTEVNMCIHPLTSYILSKPCHHLTSLSLQYYEPHYYNNLWETNVKGTKDKLIANLKNASQLTSLTLIGVHLTMYDFELIHQKLPALKKLILHKFTFRLNDTLDYPYANPQQVLDSGNAVIFADPAPAPSLEHLEILMFYDDNLEFQDAEVTFEWLKYFGKKYESLLHFTLSFVTDDLQHTMYDKQLSEEHLLPILRANTKMETFDFPFTPITPDMVGIMDANGTQLKRVVVSAYLDDLESQLKALAQSDQRNSITSVKITLHDSTEFDPDGQAAVYDGRKPRPVLDTYGDFITKPLKHFPKLTHLDVNGDKQIISVAWLPKFLAYFKHLTSLRLHNILYTEAFGSQPFVESHVKDINLDNFVFPSVLALEPCCEQLSKMLRLCPHLESFAIESCFFGLFPQEDVEVFGGSYYALPEDEDEHRSQRMITLKLDFRQNKKLKKIDLDFSDKYLYVCVYRNNDTHYTLYQAQMDKGGKLAKVKRSVPTTEYYATLYLNDSPVTINNTLISQ
ncbi:tRNA(Ser) Um(44) 2'-O-methyltransferase [Mucor velutinosus]|uniref:tRNA(Ser) Um(44) 2'-O-methyltransferase n=1 Tax=Mucor velutinosus TaxID=708070 RepID=A0AAN7D3X1_9FUNG|nr:tRNA(Ser) Um(44) 2'-O-methyltransferase [Mucor velutinosus]